MIEIQGFSVRFDGKEVVGEFPVYEARCVGEMLLILYRPESYRGGQFKNLVAFNFSGQELWKAELPTNSSMDSYYKIISEEPLIADSYCSYRCTIDRSTGRIVNKEFFK